MRAGRLTKFSVGVIGRRKECVLRNWQVPSI
jgi:hypothetical protein